MTIRRSLAGLLTALALVSGGALTACTDATNSTTGTPADDAVNRAGNDPSGVSQGNLPRNDRGKVSSTQNSDRNQNSDSDK
jgi:hypothetical protein